MRAKASFVFLTLSTLMIRSSTPAQAVGGISGAKLAAPNTATVPKGKMEFEPYFGVGYSTQEYDGAARIVGMGTRNRNYETGFRFTAGVTPTLEAGLALPILFQRSFHRDTEVHRNANGIGDMPIGLKWRFFDRKWMGLALAVGAIFPTGHHEVNEDEIPLGDGTYVPEVGFIATFELYKNLSLDLHLNYGTAIHESGSVASMGAAFDVAVGYAIGSFQPVIELAQSVGGWDGVLDYELALLGGFTWELSPAVIVVTGVRLPLIGKNTPRELGFSLAFTLLL